MRRLQPGKAHATRHRRAIIARRAVTIGITTSGLIAARRRPTIATHVAIRATTGRRRENPRVTRRHRRRVTIARRDAILVTTAHHHAIIAMAATSHVMIAARRRASLGTRAMANRATILDRAKLLEMVRLHAGIVTSPATIEARRHARHRVTVRRPVATSTVAAFPTSIAAR
jgi:hypothetical protein